MKFLFATIVFFVTAGLFADCIPWKTVESDVKAQWPKKYPGEKILSIEKSGTSELYKKMVGTGKKKKDAKTGETLELFLEKEF